MAMEALRIAAKESRFMKFILGGFIFFAVGGLVFTDVGGYFTGGARGTTVAEVGDIKIDIREFDQEFRTFASQFELTAEEAYQMGLAEQYLNARINSALQQNAAQDLNIRLSDAEIARELKSTFGDQSRDEVEMILRSQGLTEQGLSSIIQAQKTAEITSAMPKAVANYVPSSVASVFERIASEQRSGVIYTIATDNLIDGIQITDVDIQNYYDMNQGEFTLAEERIFVIGTMTTDMAKKSLPAITDEDVRAEYDARLGDYAVPEKRSIIQVNIKNPDDAQAIYEMGLAGESLKSALKNVMDSDIGYRESAEFDEASLPSELSELAFDENVKAGDVLPPVKTLLGYVVMQVEGIIDPFTKPFSDIQADLAKEMKDTQIFDSLYNKMIDTEDMLDSGAGFDDIAEKTGLKIEETESLSLDTVNASKNIDLISLINENPSVLNEIYSLSEGDSTYPVELSEEKYAVIGVRSIKPSSLLPLNDVTDDIRKILISNETQSVANAKANSIVADLNEGNLNSDALKNDLKAASKSFKSVGRDSEKHNVALIFDLNKDQFGYGTPDPKSIEIYQLNTVSYKTGIDFDVTSIKDQQAGIIDSLMTAFWRDNISVSINRNLLESQYGGGIER